MDSKDLMSLISEDVRELSLLCSGISEMESVPSSVLRLAKDKTSSLRQRIELLENYQDALQACSPQEGKFKVEKPAAEKSQDERLALENQKDFLEEVVVQPIVTKVEEPQAPEECSTEVEKMELEKVVDKVECQAALNIDAEGENFKEWNLLLKKIF